MTPWTDPDLDDFQDLPPNRLEDACLWLALALILGAGLGFYMGALSTAEAFVLIAMAGACHFVVDWVRWRR